MTRSFAALAFIVCLGVTSASHAFPPPALVQESASIDCRLIPEPGEPIETVALSERVEPANAPHPSNESERLLFRQLYETLVRVDCNNRVGPGLAASWQFDASASAWIVTLRDNARFSDGMPVTASDVLSGWTRGGLGTELRQEVKRLVRSAVVVNDRSIAITLRSPGVDSPLALAHTDLAIARRVPDSRWPLGTRPARIDSEILAFAAPSVITLIRLPEDLPPVRFLIAPGRDARDLMDEGVDLLLTREPAALNYAATLPQFASVPLAWRRTHVLLTPGTWRSSGPLSAEARQTLARDAIRGESRGALGPFWWQSLPDCGADPRQTRDQSPPTGRLVYDSGDPVARDLAERLVGLVSASGPAATAILDAILPDRPSRTFQRATGLTGEALAQALKRGNDAGYVLSFDSRPLDPCGELRTQVDRIEWLDPLNAVPLADTRLKAIVRRGHSGVAAEWDGGLLLSDSGR